MPFSPQEKHIVVNYHYVRDLSPRYGGIHPCAPREFERQLEFLASKYRIVNVEEVFRAAKEGEGESLAALTFDDGFRDSIDHVVPRLQKFHARGTFFPIAQTFEGFLPTTHKVHIVLSRFPVEELVRRFNAFLEERTPRLSETYRIPEGRRMTTARKIFDDIPTANFKEAMSIAPKEIKRKFLDALFEEADLDEAMLVKEFFMSRKEVQMLNSLGHTVGSHGWSHDALDCLNAEEINHEIVHSRSVIGDITGVEPTLFSYPQSAPGKEISSVLHAAGFTHAVIVNVLRGVTKEDNAFFIPRYDTNDVRDFLNSKNQ